jgi:hypothetical protein
MIEADNFYKFEIMNMIPLLKGIRSNEVDNNQFIGEKNNCIPSHLDTQFQEERSFFKICTFSDFLDLEKSENLFDAEQTLVGNEPAGGFGTTKTTEFTKTNNMTPTDKIFTSNKRKSEINGLEKNEPEQIENQQNNDLKLDSHVVNFSKRVRFTKEHDRGEKMFAAILRIQLLYKLKFYCHPKSFLSNGVLILNMELNIPEM